MVDELKVGIATLYRNNCNYGGLLQAFALNKVLSKYSNSVEVLSLDTPFSKTKLYIRKAKCYSFSKIIKTIKRVLSPTTREDYELLKEHRKAFKDFELSIPHSNLINKRNFENEASKYDLLVAGSDQVWNPAVWEDCYFFRNIDSKTTRKVSYAASMGCSRISKSEKRYLSNVLSDFYAISLREESGQKIIEEIIDGCEIVLDPTLMLSHEDWLNLIRDIDYSYDEPYALIYLVNKNQLHIDESITACVNIGLKCIVIPLDARSLAKAKDYNNTDNVVFLTPCSPLTWVSLIENAQLIITDSYHGIAFSVNLNRPFWCLSSTGLAASDNNPENRREYFLGMVNLNARLLTPNTQLSEEMMRSQIDFSFANSVLKKRREESWKFIDSCFKDLG